MDKKYLFGAMLAMTVAFSATTTSCSDNDDPKTEKEQPSADLDYTASNAKAWGNYMKNVAILLNNDAEKLYSQWAEKLPDNGSKHRRSFRRAFQTTRFSLRLSQRESLRPGNR